MGIRKHGKQSAHAKQCEKYKAEGRYQKNKDRKAAKHAKRMEYFRKRREKNAAEEGGTC